MWRRGIFDALQIGLSRQCKVFWKHIDPAARSSISSSQRSCRVAHPRQGRDEVFDHRAKPSRHLKIRRTIMSYFPTGQLHEIVPTRRWDYDPEVVIGIEQGIVMQVSATERAQPGWPAGNHSIAHASEANSPRSPTRPPTCLFRSSGIVPQADGLRSSTL